MREGLAAKLAELKKKKKSNVEPLFKSCDRFEDDQTEHKRNAGPSEPQAPSLGWSYTSDAGHEQETALCRMIKEGFLEEVAFGLDSGETWDRAFWLWS